MSELDLNKIGWGKTTYSVLEVLHALHGSQIKWINIYNGVEKDHGCNNCPLCKLFLGCVDCPVRIATGRSDCMGSPWERWVEHHKEEHDTEHGFAARALRCPQCKLHAAQCVHFLQQLEAQLKGLTMGEEIELGDLFKDRLITPKLERDHGHVFK